MGKGAGAKNKMKAKPLFAVSKRPPPLELPQACDSSKGTEILNGDGLLATITPMRSNSTVQKTLQENK